MKKYLSPLIKNSYKTIFKSYISSKKIYADIDFISLKILKKCSLGKKNESILAPIDSIILPSILKNGKWESHIINIIKKCSKIKNEYILLDIGANIGLTSRQILNTNIKIRKVFCFEPDSEKIHFINYNLSKYKNIKIMNYGLGKKNAKIRLYKNIYNFGDTSFLKKTPNFSKAKIKNINNFFSNNLSFNQFPIIYKSDTQGMDEEIIFSLKDKFLDKIQIAIIEITNSQIFLKNIQKFNKLIEHFNKFYCNEKIISKENLVKKIKKKDEFDLVMIK